MLLSSDPHQNLRVAECCPLPPIAICVLKVSPRRNLRLIPVGWGSKLVVGGCGEGVGWLVGVVGELVDASGWGGN